MWFTMAQAHWPRQECNHRDKASWRRLWHAFLFAETFEMKLLLFVLSTVHGLVPRARQTLVQGTVFFSFLKCRCSCCFVMYFDHLMTVSDCIPVHGVPYKQFVARKYGEAAFSSASPKPIFTDQASQSWRERKPFKAFKIVRIYLCYHICTRIPAALSRQEQKRYKIQWNTTLTAFHCSAQSTQGVKVQHASEPYRQCVVSMMLWWQWKKILYRWEWGGQLQLSTYAQRKLKRR